MIATWWIEYMGWNALREQIFANQKRLGVVPANTQLTPWPDDLKKWDTLTADEKRLFARQAEVFAAYAAYTDHAALAELERRGYEVRGKTPAQIREMLKRRPKKARTN